MPGLATNCPHKERSNHLKGLCRFCYIQGWRYGLTHEEREKLLWLQDNKCKVCSREFSEELPSVVDHDHSCCPRDSKACGKCVRGLLCARCNHALGFINDDPAVAMRLWSYLKEYSQWESPLKLIRDTK